MFKNMFRGIPKSIWLVTFLIAIVVGIVPGIILAQPHWIFLGELLGWFVLPLELVYLPIGLYQFITDSYYDSSLLYGLMTPLSYLFAMLAYGVCASWVIHHTGVLRKGLVVLGAAVCVSTLVSVSVAAITLILNDGGNVFSSFFTYFSDTLTMSGIMLVQLSISAVLGWLVSAGLARRHRRNTLVVGR